MFRCAAATLLDMARSRLGITLGLTLVLHTWTRELTFHSASTCWSGPEGSPSMARRSSGRGEVPSAREAPGRAVQRQVMDALRDLRRRA